MKKLRANVNTGSAASLVSFILLAGFLCMAVMLALLGLRGYRAISDDTSAASQLRTSLEYVAGKLHGASAQTNVRIENRQGIDTLVLPDADAGSELETRIYFSDGALYEIYTFSDSDIDPEFGTVIAELEDFEMSRDGNLFALTARTSTDITQTLHVALRGSEVGA